MTTAPTLQARGKTQKPPPHNKSVFSTLGIKNSIKKKTAMMKNLGWQMFFALLLADAVAVVMFALHVNVKIVIIVSAVVFGILAAVMAASSSSREKGRRREAEAAAKIAELQDQVVEAQKKNGPSI